MKNYFKRYKKIIVTICISVMISLFMIVMIFKNYSDFSDTLISNEQNRLLAIADTISRSIEDYIKAEEKSLEIVAQDYNFKREFSRILAGEDSILKESLEIYYKIDSPKLSNIQVLDYEGNLLQQYPFNNTSESEVSLLYLEDVKKCINSVDLVVSDVYFEEGKAPYICILQPIFIGGKFSGILRATIDVENIYEKIVKPVKTGTTGYASVKTGDAMLLMHPSDEDIGVDVLEARKGKYPQYDWSELEEVIEDQKAGGSGVSIYHSIWAGDESGTRVKKFSAYSSAYIGDYFWVVTISSDYDEVVSIIRKNYYYTLIIAAFIFLSLVVAAAYTFIARSREK
ncbi:cache domain-containing protein [Clostridium sp. DL1XJH146]